MASNRRGSRLPRRRVAAALLACAALAGLTAAVALGAGRRHAAARTSAHAVSPEAIPLGDGDVGTTPQAGSVDACQTMFRRGGAQHAGPWIDDAAGTWDKTAKPAVQGAVPWPQAYYRVRRVHGTRVVAFDDLPTNHATGVFPIATSEPAYAFDTNPNRIGAHRIRWRLPLHPHAARRPSCVGMGPIGVLRDGVFLFNGLDAAGRDAAAHEVQDSCDGHPDRSESYHHHDVPSCLLNATRNGRTTLVGYALDGYGIYVVKDAHGNLPTNGDLDACHGTTSVVRWNGKRRRVYHYVATLEYPYTVGCFHGTPIAAR